MIRTSTQPNRFAFTFRKWFSQNRLSVTSLILIIGLISFEMFNYSTTDYALRDLLGDLKFFGIFWSTILAIAFCGIDFAGIIRLFIPDEQTTDQKENWFLFGAWFLAATMNAILTWWGVAMSLTNHPIHSTAIIDPETISQVVPIFVAIMVWLTRILLIGSFSLKNKSRHGTQSRTQSPIQHPTNQRSTFTPTIQPVRMTTNTPKSAASRQPNRIVNRPEPEYVSDGTSGNVQPTYAAKSQPNNTVRRF